MKRILFVAIAVVLSLSSFASLAACKQPIYNITYHIDGELATLPEGVESTYQRSYTEDFELWKPANTATATFDGWYEDEECAGIRHTTIPAQTTGDKVYYGRYILSSYTITYNILEHEFEDLEVEGKTEEYSLSTTQAYTLWRPTLSSDYYFNGWFTNENLTGSKILQLPVNTTGNKTFYASILDSSVLEELYTIEYNLEGEPLEGDDILPTEYMMSESPTQLYTPSYNNQQVSFDGWYTNENYTGTKYLEIPANTYGDMVYYGRFIEPIGYGSGKTKANNFTVLDVFEESVSLSDFYGVTPVLVNLWQNSCIYCKGEFPDFEEVYKDKGDEIQFMIINCGDSIKTVENYISGTPYTFPVYYSLNSSAYYAMPNNGNVPITVAIDKWGYISDVFYGPIGEETLSNAVQKAIDAAL